MHDVNDMRQHVIGALDGVDQGISGNAIDQCTDVSMSMLEL